MFLQQGSIDEQTTGRGRSQGGYFPKFIGSICIGWIPEMESREFILVTSDWRRRARGGGPGVARRAPSLGN